MVVVVVVVEGEEGRVIFKREGREGGIVLTWLQTWIACEGHASSSHQSREQLSAGTWRVPFMGCCWISFRRV